MPEKATSGAETRENHLESGERRPERQDQPGGEDAPGPAKRMEALAKVVLQLHKQCGIDCKPKDFTLAVARLLELGVIDQPVDILHPDVWDKCSRALCDETMSTGSGKNLKAWGKVVQALQKARHDQETWKAARDCLLTTPRVGIGAATQTSRPPAEEGSVDPQSRQKSDAPTQRPKDSNIFSSPTDSSANSFWGKLAAEARGAEAKAEAENTRIEPPPYVPQDVAEQQEEGRGETTPGRSREGALELTSAHRGEGEENGKEKSDWHDQKREKITSEGRKANQNDPPQNRPYKAGASPGGRQGGQKGKEPPNYTRKGRG